MPEPGKLLSFPAPASEQDPGARVAADPPRSRPDDQAARDAALDVTSSYIVQAPAGAGKTELLTQRFLTLLAVVEEPEQILAITFTRAATAEMRGRILTAIENAARTPQTEGESRTLMLARAALEHSVKRGWLLLQQPHRLDVQTIDSLCLRLAHGQPLLSRLGGQLEPTEHAAGLYALAAQRTFAQLGRAPAEIEAAIEHLLLLRDNNLTNCQRLIAGMLECREQWGHASLLREQSELDWDKVRAQLEAPFAAEVRRVLEALHKAFAAEPTLVPELIELAQYACQNGSRAEIDLLHGMQTLPLAHASFLEHWGCLRSFLLTKEGTWRKSVTVRDGFPPDGDGMSKVERVRHKQRMMGLISDLHRDEQAGEQLRTLLCQVPSLPAASYEDDQWQTLVSVFRVLRHAVAELHVVFAERNQVDFAELSIAAATVLNDEENIRGLLTSEAKQHLLIDEFQDTSRRQHQLIGRLLREWQPGDGRTCFLVGDPMQSIYIFRQAEVELFGRVQRQGLDCGGHAHPCSGLTLSENFRSHAGLVDPLNRYFSVIFGEAEDAVPGDVSFAPSSAATPELEGLDAVQVHPFFCSGSDPASGLVSREAQVARVVELVEQELPRIRIAEAAVPAGAKVPGSSHPYTVAVLGRAKNHLAPIAAALRARNIPFRAIELESLAERQEILDLQSLLRALLHPMDRIAWLSVLRAPWCGLTLGDLHALTGADDASLRAVPVSMLLAERARLLSADGRERLARVEAVLERAAAERAQSLADWLERTWTSLGAPAYLCAEERENVETFFRLLDGLAPDGIDVLNGSFDTALGKLCATPDASVSEQFGVQLMTIHKAKGLGFEVVIVPALERKPGGDGSPLITMLERVRPTDAGALAAGKALDELLVAPLGRQGQHHRTYKWVQARRQDRQRGERKRLFYVACTRARRQLHLLGTAEISANDQLKAGDPESLLACAWPALGPIYQAAYDAGRRGQVAPEHEADPAAVRPAGSELPHAGLLERLVAAEDTLLDGSGAVASASPLRLWRVPRDFTPRVPLENVIVFGTQGRAGPPVAGQAQAGEQGRLARPEGSFEQRARGNAVHAMLELVSEQWAREGRSSEPAVLAGALERLARSVLRRAGIAPARSDAISGALIATVVGAASHAEGRWILEPHAGAQSEWSFSGWTGAGAEARLRTLRIDRAFRAGSEPLSYGAHCLWIIDYKTGCEPGGIALDAYLEAQKEQWCPQLEAYGSALRAFHGEQLPLRYGLYFPELLRLKSWTG